MKTTDSTSRRSFVGRLGAGALLSVPLVEWLGRSAAWAADKVYEAAKVVDAKGNVHPSVKAWFYVADAGKQERKNVTDGKMGVAAKQQFCDNCQFYQNPGVIKGTKTAVGSCSMFANRPVHGRGWCFIWAKHPNYDPKQDAAKKGAAAKGAAKKK